MALPTNITSTRPRTPPGKAARTVLAHENQDAFDNLLAGLMYDLEPQGRHQEVLVQEMAGARWRLNRAHAIESALFEIMISPETCDDSPEHRIAKSFLDQGGDPINRLERYATSLDGVYHKTHRELLATRKLRNELLLEANRVRERRAIADRKIAQAAILSDLAAPIPGYKTNTTPIVITTCP